MAVTLIMHHTTTQKAGFVYYLLRLHFRYSYHETNTLVPCMMLVKTAILLGRELLVNSTYNSESELCKILFYYLCINMITQAFSISNGC